VRAVCLAKDPGCTLTTLIGNPSLPSPNPIVPKKHSLLPLLTVLFLFSYGLMTMLIVEQGSTIESQRSLIHQLMSDSTELSTVKGKASRDKNRTDAQRRAQGKGPSASVPSVQNRASETPSAQTPLVEAPSSQVAPRHQGESRVGKGQKPKVQIPSRPAADLSDDRRSLITI
jgi:hypothetical protein